MKHTRPLAGLLTTCALSALSLVAHAQTIVLDSTFGTGGKVVDGGSYRSCDSVLVSGGKIVATNFATIGCSRYLSTGALDTTFGSSGRANTNFGATSTGQTYAIAVQADGKIILGGTSTLNSGTTLQTAVARFTANGVLDTTFSGAGKVLLDGGTIAALAVQSDGKIVASGGTSVGNGFIARFNSDGTLDTTFSGDGKLIVNNGSTAQSNGLGYQALFIQSDGKIVASGLWNGAFVTSRFNIDGTADTTFGTSGKVITDLSSGYDVPSKVVVLGDGKVAVIGTANIPVGSTSKNVIGMTRYNSSGVLDTTFSNGGTPGIVLQSFGTGDTEGASIALIGGGVFLVGGSYNGDFLATRFFSNGTLDTSFNGTGFVTADFGTSTDKSYGLIYQSGGKITLSGESNNSLALARFAPAATPSPAPASQAPSGSSS